MSSIVFTLDLEDHRPDETVEPRFAAVTDELLGDLDAWGVTGTVFVVGEVARDDPDLVARVAAQGHEIGLHGAGHTPLPAVGPDAFRAVTAEAADRLSQLVQAEIQGFRAPIFSLVPESAWAPEILGELGFTYSSSVLPARNPLFGWPQAPRDPFRWPCGLIELPSPVFGIGPLTVPLLGGAYLRVAPRPIVGWAANRAPEHGWLYAHPYDFDPDEPRWLVPEVGRLGSRVMWWGRSQMKTRVQQLVAGSRRTLADMAASLAESPDLPEFRPPADGAEAVIRSGDPAEPSSGRPQTAHQERVEAMTGEKREYGQDDMAHDLPRAEIVDRIEWLTAQCAGKRVIHVGFVDAGFRLEQGRAGSWLHGHLSAAAGELVGVDADADGVAAAAEDGFEAHAVDCTDPAAVAALGLEPADIVLAGEVIEHVGTPGPFLDAMHPLCKPDGTLIITTPNAYGLINVVASMLRRVEINHPDHVMMFTWRTLTELMRRSGWDHARTMTYVPSVRERGHRSRLEAAGVRAVVGFERLLGKLNRPFSADGLIVSAVPFKPVPFKPVPSTSPVLPSTSPVPPTAE